MERIKPPHEDSSRTTPLFYCSSIDDLQSSRETLIAEVRSWRRNEASIMTKLSNPYAVNSKFAILLGVNNEIQARVFIPKLKHIPAADESLDLKTDEITVFDGINLLKVRLPHDSVIENINREKVEQGNEPISKEQFYGPWQGDVNLFAAYSTSDRFTILDITNPRFPSKITVATKNKLIPLISLPRASNI